MAKKRIRASSKTLSSYATPKLILNNLTVAEQKREYTALRDMYQKRFKRMEEAGIANQSEFYNAWHNKTYPRGIPKISELKGKQLSYLLSDLKLAPSRYKTITMAGTRQALKKRVEALQRAHYNIPEEQVPAFKRFMERWRNDKLDHVIGSPVVVEMFESYTDEFTPDEILDNWEIFKKHLHDPERAGLYEDLAKLKKEAQKMRVTP